MSDSWNFYAARVDNAPASIYLDIGIGASAPVKDFTQLVYLRVFMLHPREDGLSSQEEFDDLTAIEDLLTRATEKLGMAHYVGRNTSSGNRDFYFYASEPQFEDVLHALMDRWPAYRFATGSRPDPEWSTYFTFLYPSPADFQRMANRDVIEILNQRADNLARPRRIDHMALFKGEADRAAFLEHLRAGGYSIRDEGRSEDGALTVEFDRVDALSEIDEVTIELERVARECNGTYDGWGCGVEL